MANVTRRASIATTLRAAGCVFAEDEAQLLIDAAHHPDQLTHMVDQRLRGLPLEHIVGGWADFCGTRIAVEPGVFVPRRRTEFVVRVAAMITKPGAVVVDLCCGSGGDRCSTQRSPGGELRTARDGRRPRGGSVRAP